MADIETLTDLIASAAKDCRDLVVDHRDAGRFVPSHYDFPTKVTWRSESEMPDVSDSFLSGPPDYSDIFRWSDKKDVGEKISFYDVPSLIELRDWFVAQPDLRDLVIPPSADAEVDFNAEDRPKWCDVADYIIFQLATEVVDHVGNTVGLDEVDSTAIRASAKALASGFVQRPPVELVAPILMVRFDVKDEFELDHDLHIERLSEEFIREKSDSFRGHGLQATLEDCATHALVLSKLELRDNTRWFGTTTDARGFISGDIDLAVSCIRLVSDVDTGYAQLIVRGVDWSAGFKADLRTHARTVSVKAFRDSLEFGWLRPTPLVSKDQLEEVRDLFAVLRGLDETHHLRVALRRLSAGMLRVDEADSLLDYCIGLEALMGDESTTEVTHKLAMRTAAILATSEVEAEPPVIYRAVKRIYRVRSKVVHGKAGSLEKGIDLGPDLGTRKPTHAALEILRHSLRAISRAPEMWDPVEIDQGILSKMVMDD